MKRLIYCTFLLLLFSPGLQSDEIPVESYSSQPQKTELDFIQQWVSYLLGSADGASARYGEGLPFSFNCGERSCRDWIKIENAKIDSADWQQDGTRLHTLVWHDKASGLVCSMELTEFKNFPAFQWLVRIKNESDTNSENIHDFCATDITWNAEGDVMPILHRAVGSPGCEDDFQLRSEIMHASMWNKSRSIFMNSHTNNEWGSANSYLIPSDKRSSAVWLPFFNYQTGSDGLVTGLGWSASWNADFVHTGNGKSTIKSGPGNFHSYLKPGESIRSPLNLVLYWQGEMMHGQNMFRKLVLEHYTPKIHGKMVEPPVSGLVWGGVPSKEHLEIIEKIQEYKIPLDVYWFDAGWYGTGVVPSYTVFEGDWGPMAGDWRPNPNWHNGTLKPVSDAAHAAGMKFLVWVEPCRAIQGRPITLERPELFYGHRGDETRTEGETLLLDLGKSDSLQWAIDVVSNLVEQYDIDWYEEDFNIEPNPYLEARDEQGRTGMNEMRFVEGHFKFWDTLLEKFPNLAILNCASGGRRIDLESIRRGQPLWRSDYNCFPEATPESTQDQSFNISYWLPIQGSMIRGWLIFDTYEARSALSPGAENGLVAKTDEEWKQIKKNVEMQKACKKYFYGDFYPLTNTQRSHKSWMAYHLYLPEEKKGMILAMRRDQSDVSAMTFDLLTIDPETSWTFRDYDTGETQTVSGQEIREKGYEIVIPERRSSRLIFYSREE
ncbi:MAG: alpha-galactosidase [Planctomycetia bacterium]|nr:alpha-galactosidase [Planctomycetia bacterium]